MDKKFACILFLMILFGCQSKQKETLKEKDIYKKIDHSVEYIDPENALYTEGFKACNENQIFNYYNPQKAFYNKGKNKLREFILENYNKKDYTDSGYLNVHFVINCKGETGRFKVYENDLDLQPYTFNSDLRNHLTELTRLLKPWTPNIINGEKKDTYMYISYKIKNGEIIEILP